MNYCTNDSLRSEVTKRRNEVKAGTILVYCDQNNYEKVVVTEVGEDHFAFVDTDGYDDYKFFDELQIGWSFY
jgi:hypothetical protein